ncbi:MAG: site-specific recombinase xerd [Halapricum sp.]
MSQNTPQSTDSGESDITTSVDGINTVPDPSREQLTERQLLDYADHRTKLLKWALNLEKNPEKAEGYAHTTVAGYAYRLDLCYRWVWQERGGYTTAITHEHADDFVQHLAYKDSTEEDKASHVKALKMLFRWRGWEFGDDPDWNPPVSFSSGNVGNTNPPDFLSVEERQQIREAVLEYGSVPTYSNCTPQERSRIKAHLAQRFEKPKSAVTPQDFERANGWKWPSLFWTALDTGLRPIEVKRANVRWVDVNNRVLRIPRDESSKNSDNWTVSLTDRTAEALRR